MEIAYKLFPYGCIEIAPLGAVRNEHGEASPSVFIQSDWDYPGVAGSFGFIPCECGETDGTIDCPHRSATDMIAAAYEYLREHEGKVMIDPGYFNANR